ncbi:MAG TPA: tripartite tricarboxylate transporter substrate binding protein [Burkholderiales bacterium]|nr:tripartite tricarboxylate transporter substrate binding protein [Burkholderiales bacterium]
MLNKSLTRLLAACFIFAVPCYAGAQGYPARPIRMVVPFPPGGSIDVLARPLAQKMSELMGQQVVVDYRSGASGNIGTEITVRAPADGYTIMITTIPLVVNPSLYAKLPFDVAKDLAPVSLLAASPFVMVVHPSVPAKSVRDLIALAKARPGKLNYASAGNGTNLHVAAELFKNLTKTNIVHVPYKGGGPALAAMLSGETDLSFLGVVPATPYIKAGKMRGLATTGTKRTPVLPDLPTVAESGVKGYEFASWYGVLAPAGTPANVINALNDYIIKALRSSDLGERFAREGAEIIASSPAQFAAHLKSELVRWAKVAKEAGLHAD